ncbi:MAG TPA: class I SAM-dependent methyltransferase [Anaerolineales bacterium]|jgi:23S rRNA (cytosine1962-C5)-methyltransferase
MTELAGLLDLAFSARASLVDGQHCSAFRLFNGFLEGFPSLSLDLYARTALIHDYSEQELQVATATAWIIQNLPWVQTILVKSRGGSGSSAQRGRIIHGNAPDRQIMENDTWYAIDLGMNRDASLYLDTRNLRTWAKANLAGKTVLNTFAYTGSLGVAALAGGAAHVTQLDRNPGFLKLASRSCAMNRFEPARMHTLARDFFPALGEFKRSGLTFDCVFLDPPYFASTSKGTVDLQTGSTRLINKVRPLVNDGGWLVAINNALFVSGAGYLASLEALCADGYLSIEQFIPIPSDFTGYPQTIAGSPPADPSPFNHSTKIAILRVRRKSPPVQTP